MSEWRKSSYSSYNGSCVEVKMPDPDPQPEPLAIERGRYAVYETPDGSWIIARSSPICQTCQDCGCGDPADPIQVPGMIVSMAKAQQANGGGLLAKAKAVLSGR